MPNIVAARTKKWPEQDYQYRIWLHKPEG